MSETATQATPAWTTQDEIRFLRRLGTHRASRIHGPSRQVLLRRYLRAARYRQEWGAVDKLAVMAALATMLREPETPPATH